MHYLPLFAPSFFILVVLFVVVLAVVQLPYLRLVLMEWIHPPNYASLRCLDGLTIYHDKEDEESKDEYQYIGYRPGKDRFSSAWCG
jgi:hypothetical protein